MMSSSRVCPPVRLLLTSTCNITAHLRLQQQLIMQQHHSLSSSVTKMRPARALVAAAMSPFTTKRLYIIRHGQAMHNPRAEKARAEGCSHDEFLEIMRQDDHLDAPLTKLGVEQAKNGEARYGHLLQDAELVVSSPLSRAMQTADAIVPPSTSDTEANTAHSSTSSQSTTDHHARSFATSSSSLNLAPKRLVFESLREINGWLLNAKRRSRSDLEKDFPAWDFSELEDEEDCLWTDELETQPDCAERGYLSLLSLAKRPEQKMVIVAHGGLLRFTMNMHPRVGVRDGRNVGKADDTADLRCSKSRFGNCEVRAYELDLVFENKADLEGDVDLHSLRPDVVLTEVDLEELPN